MTKAHRRALGLYLRALADKLELRDWTVNLEIAKPDTRPRADGKQWGASSESTPGRKQVTVTFPPEVTDWDPDELRQTAVHELVHAHLAPLMEMIRIDLREHLGWPTYSLFCDGSTRWLEFAVEAWADSVSKHLPMLDWEAA